MKRWTNDEVATLREHYGKSSLSEIAQMVGRSKNSVAAKVRTLGLDETRPQDASKPLRLVPEGSSPAAACEREESGRSRLERLKAIRDRMEEAIETECIPTMQQAAYYREYRSTLAEIDELEHAHEREDGEGEQGTLAAALAELAEQQRRYLDRAAVS